MTKPIVGMTKATLYTLLLGIVGCESQPKAPNATDQARERLFYNLDHATHLNLTTTMINLCTVDALKGKEDSPSCRNVCSMTDALNREIAQAPPGIKDREPLRQDESCRRYPVWGQQDWDKLMKLEKENRWP
jgi:hypothetical protein